jgi:hypothetical protein
MACRAEYLVDEMSPFALQTVMFLVTLREQASDEQQAEWLPKAERWEIIGSYAQVSQFLEVMRSHLLMMDRQNWGTEAM